MKQSMLNDTRILIVDDEKIMRDSCCRVLQKEGYSAYGSVSGEEALEKFDQEQFDLVLLDLKMPGIGGIETLRRLKEMDSEITIMIITGYPSIETAVKAIKLGA